MNKFGLVLRQVVFFLFPLPFLLSFAVEHGADWTGYLAYVACGALLLATIAAGWAALRQGDGR